VAAPVVYTIRIMGSGFPDTIHTVTFDCWSTLIYEATAPADGAQRKRSGSERRAARLASLLTLDPQLAAALEELRLRVEARTDGR